MVGGGQRQGHGGGEGASFRSHALLAGIWAPWCHRGVLFRNELPEFAARVLGVMRRPLEDRVLTISGTRGSQSPLTREKPHSHNLPPSVWGTRRIRGRAGPQGRTQETIALRRISRNGPPDGHFRNPSPPGLCHVNSRRGGATRNGGTLNPIGFPQMHKVAFR